MEKAFKIAEIHKDCVACGSCAIACPIEAIKLHLGITAKVDHQKCIGCGKCAQACPAAVISLSEKERSK